MHPEAAWTSGLHAPLKARHRRSVWGVVSPALARQQEFNATLAQVAERLGLKEAPARSWLRRITHHARPEQSKPGIDWPPSGDADRKYRKGRREAEAPGGPSRGWRGRRRGRRAAGRDTLRPRSRRHARPWEERAHRHRPWRRRAPARPRRETARPGRRLLDSWPCAQGPSTAPAPSRTASTMIGACSRPDRHKTF